MSDSKAKSANTAPSPAPSAPAVPRRPRPHRLIVWLLLAAALEVAAVLWTHRPEPKSSAAVASKASASPSPAPAAAGDLIKVDSQVHLTPVESAALIKHDYPAGVPGPSVGITKYIFHYRSQLPSGELITVYGRAYLPDNPRSNLPIFAFAPGTTGIGDQCAPSLEKPAVANWADYDSHMSAYANEGYAAVTTDYEGMRDPARLHHYMIGELEGRALLDSIRALRHLPAAHGRLSDNLYLSGYSQGGHAAFWADKIAGDYAPDIKPLGVVGFGPVMSVQETLTDITRGANINWFGPNVLLSYQDYYGRTYPGIIQPARESHLATDVLAHCIDTDLPYWGHTPANIYTPEFIQAAQTNTVADKFPEFAAALEANAVGEVPTATAKRINEGAEDNVVLPAQQQAAAPVLCASSAGPVQLVVYPGTTHYTAMLHGFNDTLNWMKALALHQPVPSTCAK